MPRRCTICEHTDRLAIDKALVLGQSLRSLSKQYGVSMSALSRHRKSHLAALLAKADAESSVGDSGASDEKSDQVPELVRGRRSMEAVEAAHALDMLQQLKAVNGACLEVLKRARSQEKPGTLLQAVDRIHRQIEIQSRLLVGQTSETESAMESRWPEIRGVLLEALGPFPEARRAVVEALPHVGA